MSWRKQEKSYSGKKSAAARAAADKFQKIIYASFGKRLSMVAEPGSVAF